MLISASHQKNLIVLKWQGRKASLNMHSGFSVTKQPITDLLYRVRARGKSLICQDPKVQGPCFPCLSSKTESPVTSMSSITGILKDMAVKNSLDFFWSEMCSMGGISFKNHLLP